MTQRAARQAAEFEFGVANWGLAELVEAAARSDRRELAVDSVDQLAGTSGTDWALGVLARSRALVTDGDAAEPLYREAIEQLDRTRVRMELGRAHLLYGEWLRREQRRVDAREHLRTAHGMFGRFGAEAFAERARRETRSIGDTTCLTSHVLSGSVEITQPLCPLEAATGLAGPPECLKCAVRDSPSANADSAGSAGSVAFNVTLGT